MSKQFKTTRLGVELLEVRDVPASWVGGEGFSTHLDYRIPKIGFALTTVQTATVGDLAPGDEVRVRASLTPGPRPPGPTTLTVGRNSQSGLISLTGHSSGERAFTASASSEQVSFRAGNYDIDDTANLRIDVRRQPDLAAVRLVKRADGAGVAFDVTVRRNFLPQDVSVALFWNDDRSGNVMLKEAWRGTLPRGTRQDQVVSFSLLSSSLSSAPAGATRLIGVVDWNGRLAEPNESNQRAELRLTPINLAGTRGSTSGSRGAITNGVFTPVGTRPGEDTRHQDRRQAEGALTSAQQREYTDTLSRFLRGETLSNYIIGIPSAAERSSIINPILARFLAGTGGTLTHNPGSALSDLVRSSGNFRYLNTTLTTHVQQQIAAQAANGNVDFGALRLTTFLIDPRHNINYPPQDVLVPFTLRAVLGGTQAIRATVEMRSVTPTISMSGGQVSYSAVVRYEIFDVFGAGNNDRYVPPLEAMWQLQHRGSRAKPFNNRVVVEETITGQFAVPERFNTFTAK